MQAAATRTSLNPATATVTDYMPLVVRVAKKIARRIPSVVNLDELISAGTLGLIDAMSRFDPTRAARFESYAEFRIRGAILDELRHMDWLPRTARARVRRGEATQCEAVVSIEDVRADGFDGFVSTLGADSAPNAPVENRQRKARVATAIAALPLKEQQVLSLYYVEELTLKQIGEVFGVTESRICQIHTHALARLREALLDDADLR